MKLILSVFLICSYCVCVCYAQIDDKSIDPKEGQVLSLINTSDIRKLVIADKSNEIYITGVYKEKIKNIFSSGSITKESFISEVNKTEYEFDITTILVNNENGFIKKGDVLMVSSTPGTAMKSNRSGMMVGIALEDQNLKQKTALIKCRIMIQYYCGK